MANPESGIVPGARIVPMGYYERQIRDLMQKVKELENKIDSMQELIDQYEWVIGD